MTEFVEKVLTDAYGLKVLSLSEMEGYESKNFKVVSDQGLSVMKLYPHDDATWNLITAENRVLQYLEKGEESFPKILNNTKGESLTLTEDSHGQSYICRHLSFLEGVFWGEAKITHGHLASLGNFLAKMDVHLSDLHPVEFIAKKLNWDLDQFLVNESLIAHIDEPSQRKLVEYFFLQYKEKVLPQFHALRKSLIHNDANDWNVLVDQQKVTGIIDFGDMVYSSTINELAVALTYVLMDRHNPIADASIVVKAYHQIYPLRPEELSVLYYLIAARLCTSVCNSAFTKKIKPDSTYITISERPAWTLLEKWITISPIGFRQSMMDVCGFSRPLEMSSDWILSERQKYMSPSLSLSYKQPIHMKSAAFQYMYDADGRAILDAYNNIIQVGHCHPQVVEAGQRAMARLNTNTRYLYEELAQYADRLLVHFPPQLNKLFMVNSGSAASDLAIRLATTHTRKNKIAVVQHGYHGNTRIGIDISQYKYGHKGGMGRREFIIEAELPDTYRGTYRNKETAGHQYAQDLIISLENERDIAAFIAEPIVGCGGQVPLAEGYLKHVYAEIRHRGGVCISDEVQVGFGRLGTHFWGFEMQGVIPDIVILGKPMGNGHPIGAVVCTEEIAQSFNNGMEFFSSFGGNPVSCEIGRAVLDVINQEQLQSHAHEVGTYMMNQFRQLSERYTCIGDVRGSGLFIGVDIVKNHESRDTDRELASMIKNEMRSRNILISTDGPDDSVIKIKPPLCFTKANVDHVIEHFKYINSYLDKDYRA